MADKSVSIVLASASPRRKQLLAKGGYKFTVFPPDIDESAFLSEAINSCEYAKRLALAKARNVGKPGDAKEAEQITRKLFSAPHKVITAVAIVRLTDDTEIVESDTTIVHPREISAEQIAGHIRSGCWRDKAGAYAIQEDGDEFIEKIEGSLTNVMGLPMELLTGLLRAIVE